MYKRAWIPLAAVLVLVLAGLGYAQASVDEGPGEPARATTAVPEATEGNTVEEDSAELVTVRVEGDAGTSFAGTSFAGTCSADGSEEKLGGEVPAEFTYRLNGGKLECEVRATGPEAGVLKVLVISGDEVRIRQQLSASVGKLQVTYSENSVSSKVTSSSVQSSSVTSSSGSTVSSVQSSSSVVSDSSSD